MRCASGMYGPKRRGRALSVTPVSMNGARSAWRLAVNEEPCSRPVGRHQGARACLVGALFLLGACATSGEPVERLVADAGVRTTRVLAYDADGFTRRLEEGDATAAFVATWRACNGSTQCAIAAPSSIEQAQRRELADAVVLRAEAIAGLNRAYAAFRAEVTGQSEAPADRAIREAITGTVSYGNSLAGLQFGSGTAGLARPLERAAGAMASVAVAGQRRSRMLIASAALAEATTNLREAMMLETRKYDALTEVLVRERIDAHRSLLQAGLVSGAGALRPVADRLGVPLARDADLIVARSASARIAVEAMIEASERAEIRRTQLRYRAAVNALIELEQVHAQMNAGATPDLSELDQALWNLERLADPTAGPAVRTVATATGN